MIYYVSLDNPLPSGGVKTQYRHVEILNKNGYPAAMLHQVKPFTATTWFSSTARIEYVEGTEIASGDVLVWPEILRSSIINGGGIKSILFNQNIHYTFRGFLNGQSPIDYANGAIGTMVLTEYEKELLEKYASVSSTRHPIHVVRHGIDPLLWAYDDRPKKKQICFMPRKHIDEAETVFGWLSSIGALQGWEIQAIHNQHEREVAEIFKDSMYFFAFGYPEGGTLPPFEALAAGCTVVGYGGFASDKLLEEAGGHVVPSGNTMQFVKTAEFVLNHDWTYERRWTSPKVLDMFNMKQEENSLIRFFKEVVDV